ncbi:MAG: SufE family protein [Bacteroidia bacterium]|nr:SufE family protein [Bacteroidia bacterium]MCZ2276393.1 SufE family protein [Bacteroidia bacterium]
MKSLAETEQEIIDDFTFFENWEDKYNYIIEIGQQLPSLNDKYKIDELRIQGCQSSVWLHCSEKDGRIYFEADSDSVFVKGEIALLIKVMSGKLPDEIVNAKLGFIDTIGLRQQLSMTRANGLASMIRRMKQFAAGA